MSQEAGVPESPAPHPAVDLDAGLASGFWLPIWRRFRKNRLGVISGIILVVLYTLAVFAPFFSPYPFDEFHGKVKFAPPQRIRVFDEQGRLTAPFTYAYKRQMDPETLALNYQEDRSTRYRVRFFVRGEPYRVLFVIPARVRFIGIEEGGTLFLLGTDVLGRDLLSRILTAAQVSLSVPLVGTFITVVLGLILGVASGYFGGVIDDVIQGWPGSYGERSWRTAGRSTSLPPARREPATGASSPGTWCPAASATPSSSPRCRYRASFSARAP